MTNMLLKHFKHILNNENILLIKSQLSNNPLMISKIIYLNINRSLLIHNKHIKNNILIQSINYPNYKVNYKLYSLSSHKSLKSKISIHSVSLIQINYFDKMIKLDYKLTNHYLRYKLLKMILLLMNLNLTHYYRIIKSIQNDLKLYNLIYKYISIYSLY